MKEYLFICANGSEYRKRFAYDVDAIDWAWDIPCQVDIWCGERLVNA